MNNFDRALQALQEEKTDVRVSDVKNYLGDAVVVSKIGPNKFKVVEAGSDRGLSKKLKSIFKSYPQLKEIEFSYKDSASGEMKKEVLKGGK